jgi:MFS family permease
VACARRLAALAAAATVAVVLSVWRSVRALPGWLQVLLLGQFVNAAGALAWVYLTLYLVTARDLSTGTAGLLTGVNGLGLIIGNFGGGALGDRFGLRRSLVTGLLGWAITCALVPATPVGLLAPLLLVAGALGGVSRPLMSAVVLRELPVQQRRTGAALWRVAFNAGAIIGPPLGGLAAGRDFWVVFAADAASSVVLAVVVLMAAPGDERRAAAPHSGRGSVLRHVRADRLVLAVLVGAAVVDTCYRQLYVGLPLELHHLGAPAWVYGLTVTLNCVVIVLGEVWLALRMAHRSTISVIAAGYVLVGLSWLLFGAHPAVWSAMAMVVVISIGEMLYKPTATAAVADAAPAGFEGRYQSLYAGASITGTVLGPAIGGALYGLHPTWLWLGAGVVPIAAAVALRTAAGARSGSLAGSGSVGDLGGA